MEQERLDSKEKRVKNLENYVITSKRGGKQERRDKESVDAFLRGEENPEGEDLFQVYKKIATGHLDNFISISFDGEGSQLTKHYKDIYFNEIIQNANDQQSAPWYGNGSMLGETREDAEGQINGNTLDITVEHLEESGLYQYTFQYQDLGFSFANIVGFLGPQVHGKEGDSSTTGKHGVGIKSLYYFVKELKMESNVTIHVKIEHEENTEKSGNTSSSEEDENAGILLKTYFSVEKNNDWDNTTTKLTMTFSDQGAGEHNFDVGKLCHFSQALLKGDYATCATFLTGDSLENTVFDWRNMLFTDKNLGKEHSIKRISWNGGALLLSAQTEQKLALSEKSEKSEESEESEESEWVEKTSLSLRAGQFLQQQEFLSFSFPEAKERITLALPVGQLRGEERYYHTYYIPVTGEKRYPFAFLINGVSTNHSRIKLTDDENEKNIIHQRIDGYIFRIYEMMCSEELNKSFFRTEISQLFHEILISCQDGNPIGISAWLNRPESNVFTTKYMQKWQNETPENESIYIFYLQEEMEKYQKYVPSSMENKPDLPQFFAETVKKKDSLAYAEAKDGLLDKVRACYDIAFGRNTTLSPQLLQILNACCGVGELYAYRIFGDTMPEITENQGILIQDQVLDQWHLAHRGQVDNWDYWVDGSLQFLGRYGLSRNISTQGRITQGDICSFLYAREINDENFGKAEQPAEMAREHGDVTQNYRLFQDKSQAMYATKEVWELRAKMESALRLFTTVTTNRACYRYDAPSGAYENKDLLYSQNNNVDSVWLAEGEEDPWKYIKLLCHLCIEHESLRASVKKLLGKPSLAKGLLFTHSVATKWKCGTRDWARDHKFLKWFVYESCGTGNTKWVEHGIYYISQREIVFPFCNKLEVTSIEDLVLYLEFIEKIPLRREENLYGAVSTLACGVITPEQKPLSLGRKAVSLFFAQVHQKVFGEVAKKLEITLEEDVFAVNYCDPVLFDFVQTQFGIQVILQEEPLVKDGVGGKQVMYLRGNQVMILALENEVATLTAPPQGENTQYIWYSKDNIKDQKEVIRAVLSKRLGQEKAEALSLIDSVICNKQDETYVNECSSELFDQYHSKIMERVDLGEENLNIESRPQNWNVILSNSGAQGKECACCGEQHGTKKLAIFKNCHDNSDDYPYLYFLLCETCFELVSNSLLETKLCMEENRPLVKWKLLLRGMKQEKILRIQRDLTYFHQALCSRLPE